MNTARICIEVTCSVYFSFSRLIHVNTLKLVESEVLKSERDLLFCHNFEEQKTIVIFSRISKKLTLLLFISF